MRRYKISQIFDRPVDPEKDQCPDYFKVITKPMALQTVEYNLKEDKYATVDDFKADMNLIWENGEKFNAGSWVELCATHLKLICQKLVSHFTDDSSQDWLQEFKIIDAKLHKIYKVVTDPNGTYPKATHKHHDSSSKEKVVVKEEKPDNRPSRSQQEDRPQRKQAEPPQQQAPRHKEKHSEKPAPPPPPPPEKVTAPPPPPPPQPVEPKPKPATQPKDFVVTKDLKDQIFDYWENASEEDQYEINKIIRDCLHLSDDSDEEISVDQLNPDCIYKIAQFFHLV